MAKLLRSDKLRNVPATTASDRHITDNMKAPQPHPLALVKPVRVFAPRARIEVALSVPCRGGILLEPRQQHRAIAMRTSIGASHQIINIQKATLRHQPRPRQPDSHTPSAAGCDRQTMPPPDADAVNHDWIARYNRFLSRGQRNNRFGRPIIPFTRRKGGSLLHPYAVPPYACSLAPTSSR